MIFVPNLTKLYKLDVKIYTKGEVVMKDIILAVSLTALGLIFIVLCIYISLMLGYKPKIKKNFSKSPKNIVNKYLFWYLSFVLWTLIEYFLLLVPLFTSVATVYFATDLAPNGNNTVTLTVMSIITALLPLISSKVLPKVHSDGFYKGVILLENAMLKYDYDLISVKELIDISEIAEKFTNPLAHLEDLEISLMKKQIYTLQNNKH